MDGFGSYAPIVGAVSGAVLGFVGGIVSEPLRERLFAAKLHIDSPERGNLGETEEGVYVKLRVTNKKPRMAKSCRVYLVGLHEIINGKAIRSVLRDSFQLPWSGYDFEPRDVPTGVSQYVDAVKFSKHSSGWVFATKPGFYQSLIEKTALHKGTYRLTVLVAADGARPYSRQVDVFYDGDWNRVRVWET